MGFLGFILMAGICRARDTCNKVSWRYQLPCCNGIRWQCQPHYDDWNLAGNSASPLPKGQPLLSWHCHRSLWFNYHFASNSLDWYMHSNIQSCIGECGANSTGYESGPIRKSQQRLIHYLVRWWDRLARFTIPRMISRILVGIWQYLSCMYSCLISYCSNQRSDDAIHAHGWTQCWSMLAGSRHNRFYR